MLAIVYGCTRGRTFNFAAGQGPGARTPKNRARAVQGRGVTGRLGEPGFVVRRPPRISGWGCAGRRHALWAPIGCPLGSNQLSSGAQSAVLWVPTDGRAHRANQYRAIQRPDPASELQSLGGTELQSLGGAEDGRSPVGDGGAGAQVAASRQAMGARRDFRARLRRAAASLGGTDGRTPVGEEGADVHLGVRALLGIVVLPGQGVQCWRPHAQKPRLFGASAGA